MSRPIPITTIGIALLIATNLHATPPCTEGRVPTDGHCCWPNQSWSNKRQACIGLPICPQDYRRVLTDCLPNTTPHDPSLTLTQCTDEPSPQQPDCDPSQPLSTPLPTQLSFGSTQVNCYDPTQVPPLFLEAHDALQNELGASAWHHCQNHLDALHRELRDAEETAAQRPDSHAALALRDLLAQHYFAAPPTLQLHDHRWYPSPTLSTLCGFAALAAADYPNAAHLLLAPNVASPCPRAAGALALILDQRRERACRHLETLHCDPEDQACLYWFAAARTALAPE